MCSSDLYVYGDLKREEPVRTGSVILHEHYFDNLGGDGRANGPALKLLTVDYGAVAAKYVEVFIEHPRYEAAFMGRLLELDEVLECHHITGEF